MADRFPLILNTNINQIQEIASGDTLDLTGSNIKGVGIITAGNISGNIIAGAGSSNIVAGIITATQIDLNGDIDVDGHTNLDNVNVSGATTTTGILNITANTASTNTTSGALRVAGGVGIQGSINVGESVNITADLDVDGHTNLDNVSVAGVSTFTGNADFSAGVDVTGDINVTSTLPVINLIDSNSNDDFAIKNVDGVFTIRDATNGADRLTINSNGKTTFPNDVECSSFLTIESGQPTIQLNDTNANDDFAIRNVNGVFGVRDITNGADRFTINSSGVVNIPGNTDFGAGIDVTGNATVSGNLSVGGVLTYEDVTNVDSVGIVTARTGVFIPDDNTLKFGNTSASPDLKIEHVTSGTFNRLHASNGYMQYRASAHFFNDEASSINYIRLENNRVDLRYNGSAKLTTETSGVNITGICTATTFSGSGASLTNLPAAQLSGTAAAINGSNITNVNAATVGGITAGSFLRSDASDVFNCNGNNLSFDFDTSGRDSIQFTQGGSLRFQLVHSNNGNDIDIVKHNSAADIKIAGSRILTTADEGTGNGLDADTVDGIQGSNIMTLSGTQTIAGTKIFNCSGYDIQLTYDNSRTLVSILRGSGGSPTEKVRLHTSGDTVLVETFSSGVIRWKSGLVPNDDDTYDLGATGTRWRNLYVNDLQLSNESKKDKGGNDVDGTWGDWTLQEGDENIFMLNNRTGKKYKMDLTEVK